LRSGEHRGKWEDGEKEIRKQIGQLPGTNKPTAWQHDKPHCAAVDRKNGELEERGDSAGEEEGERKLGSWTKREEETEKDGGR
jgi:hypothetical protein